MKLISAQEYVERARCPRCGSDDGEGGNQEDRITNDDVMVAALKDMITIVGEALIEGDFDNNPDKSDIEARQQIAIGYLEMHEEPA